TVVVESQLRRRDALADLLAARRGAGQDRPRAETSADLVGQGAEDQRVEEDGVPPRLSRFRDPCEARDVARFLPRFLRRELGELRRARDAVSAGLQGDQGPDGQVQAGPMVVALHAIRGGQEMLVLVIPEGARTFLPRLVSGTRYRTLC